MRQIQIRTDFVRSDIAPSPLVFRGILAAIPAMRVVLATAKPAYYGLLSEESDVAYWNAKWLLVTSHPLVSTNFAAGTGTDCRTAQVTLNRSHGYGGQCFTSNVVFGSMSCPAQLSGSSFSSLSYLSGSPLYVSQSVSYKTEVGLNSL
jgi:hypothetical protein